MSPILRSSGARGTKAARPKLVSLAPLAAMPGGEVDDIAISWEPRPLHLAGVEFRGWAAVLRNGPDSTSRIVIN